MANKKCWPWGHIYALTSQTVVRNEAAEHLAYNLSKVRGCLDDLLGASRPRVHSVLTCRHCGNVKLDVA